MNDTESNNPAADQFVDAAVDASLDLMALRTVTLDEPLPRGKGYINTVSVRKPGAGELRGVSLSALSEMDVTALHRVLPRVTTPMLTQRDVENLAPADLLQLGVAVASFLLTTAQRREAFPS